MRALGFGCRVFVMEGGGRTYYDSFWGGIAGEFADFFEGVVFWFRGGAVGSSVWLALAVGVGGGVGAEEG